MSSELYICSPSNKMGKWLSDRIQARAKAGEIKVPSNIAYDLQDFGEVVLFDGAISDIYLRLVGCPKFPATKEGTIEAAKWLEAESGLAIEANIRYHYFGGFRDQRLYPPVHRVKGIQVEEVGDKVYVIGKTFDIKDSLKSLGFRWDRTKTGWWIPKGRWGSVEPRVALLINKVLK